MAPSLRELKRRALRLGMFLSKPCVRGVHRAYYGRLDSHHEARPNELSDQVLAILRDAAQRLTASSWTAHTVSPTVSGFVADLVSGYSTLDLPPDELRIAALAAGTLTCAAALTGWSIGQLLDAVDLRDELETAR